MLVLLAEGEQRPLRGLQEGEQAPGPATRALARRLQNRASPKGTLLERPGFRAARKYSILQWLRSASDADPLGQLGQNKRLRYPRAALPPIGDCVTHRIV